MIFDKPWSDRFVTQWNAHRAKYLQAFGEIAAVARTVAANESSVSETVVG